MSDGEQRLFVGEHDARFEQLRFEVERVTAFVADEAAPQNHLLVVALLCVHAVARRTRTAPNTRRGGSAQVSSGQLRSAQVSSGQLKVASANTEAKQRTHSILKRMPFERRCKEGGANSCERRGKAYQSRGDAWTQC